MKEIWKDIKGYKGLYKASNKGRFKSLRTGKILSPSFPENKNTSLLGLMNRRGCLNVLVPSRIIAELFIANPKKHGIVKYKKDRRNLSANNLYYISYSESIKATMKKYRTRVSHNYICKNKKCRKIFNVRSSNKKRPFCSRKCITHTYKTRMKISKIKHKPIIAIKGDKKIRFSSIESAGLFLKRNSSGISNALHGRVKTVAGYTFKFLKQHKK